MRRRFIRALGAGLLSAGMVSGVLAEPQAQLVSSFTWENTQQRKSFGGFSGLEVSADGADFLVISDSSLRVSGRFTRDNDIITGLETSRIVALMDAAGHPIWQHPPEEKDSEGLVWLPDGRFYISFEGDHRVELFENDQSVLTLPLAPEFSRFFANGSLEGLAIDAQGALYTVPERSGQMNRAFPVFRFLDGLWTQPFAITRDAGFLTTGLDFGPDGYLYLLERQFTGLSFRSRVRKLDITAPSPNTGQVVWTSDFGEFDNLEGLAVWQDTQGRIRLTMISDDNFQRMQKTQFVEIAITQ